MKLKPVNSLLTDVGLVTEFIYVILNWYYLNTNVIPLIHKTESRTGSMNKK